MRQASEVIRVIRETNMRLRTWHLGPFPGIHTSNRIASNGENGRSLDKGLLASQLTRVRRALIILVQWFD